MKRKLLAFLCALSVTSSAMGINLSNDNLWLESPIQVVAASTSADEFVLSATDLSGTTVYTGSSDSSNFNMNGRTYYQGLVFDNTYYSSSNTSSATFNVSGISKFACTIGHVDNSTRDSATVKVYLDDILQDEFNLSSNMPLQSYNLDVSESATLKFVVTRNSRSIYAFANITVNGSVVEKSYYVPEYTSPEDFIASGYGVEGTTVYNGKSQATSFNMNGRTYYQGLAFDDTYYSSSNTSRVYYNTENVSSFSCTIGHIDNSSRDSATVKVYLDDVLYEEFTLTSNMPLMDYTLDVSGSDNLVFIVSRNSRSQYAFADINVDGNDTIRSCSIPTYSSAEGFIASGYGVEGVTVYNGKSKATTFNMNGRTYYQGLAFDDTYYSSSNTSRVYYNTENVSSFSCTIGHIDNSSRDSATVKVYLDDVLYEEFALTNNMPLMDYSLDVSNANNLVFIVSRNSRSQYAFADISVDGNDTIKSCAIPTYTSAEDFITNGYGIEGMTVYNGKSQATTFNMNGRTYYQGLAFDDTYYSSSNTSRVYYNTENVSAFSCTIGHIDNSSRDSATVKVYLDDVLYEEFTLTNNMPLMDYSLDVSNADNLAFIVSRNSRSQYAFADISVDGVDTIKSCSIPEYESAESFLTSGYGSEGLTIYDGKSQATTFSINGNTYNQGIAFDNIYYSSSNSSRIYYNTENISEMSFVIGHIDGSAEKDAKLYIYLDDTIFDTITLTSAMSPLEYSLNTSNSNNVAFIVDRTGRSQFAFADVQIVTQNKEYIMGDVNMDGKFNVSDVVLLQKWLLAVPNTKLADWKAADFYGDGKLDVFDLCLMKRALLS